MANPERHDVPGDGADGDHEFAGLLRGHALQCLTPDEGARLHALVGAEPPRAREIADVDAVHGAFARERSLCSAMAGPVEARDEADQSFGRLAAAAARAEAELRSKLLHSPAPLRLHARRRPWRAAACVAALAAGILAVLWLSTGGPPPLQTTAPGREVAGGESTIVIAPRVSASDRTLSWSPLWHAASYEVVIVDASCSVVLQRAPSLARSTRWELTLAEFERLQRAAASQGELRLRVRALDGAGLPVGTSGDLPLSLR